MFFLESLGSKAMFYNTPFTSLGKIFTGEFQFGELQSLDATRWGAQNLLILPSNGTEARSDVSHGLDLLDAKERITVENLESVAKFIRKSWVFTLSWFPYERQTHRLHFLKDRRDNLFFPEKVGRSYRQRHSMQKVHVPYCILLQSWTTWFLHLRGSHTHINQVFIKVAKQVSGLGPPTVRALHSTWVPHRNGFAACQSPCCPLLSCAWSIHDVPWSLTNCPSVPLHLRLLSHTLMTHAHFLWLAPWDCAWIESPQMISWQFALQKLCILRPLFHSFSFFFEGNAAVKVSQVYNCTLRWAWLPSTSLPWLPLCLFGISAAGNPIIGEVINGMEARSIQTALLGKFWTVDIVQS